MQSAWAIGYAAGGARELARAGRVRLRLAGGVLRRRAAGALHAVDSAPRRGTRAIWRAARTAAARPCRLAAGARRPDGCASPSRSSLMNACTLFAWWGFNLWVPVYLSRSGRKRRHRPVHRDDVRVHHRHQGRHVVRLRDVRLHQRRDRPQAHLRRLSDRGRGARVGLHVHAQAPLRAAGARSVRRFLRPGYFSGFGAVTAEIYPTAIRATAQGFTYNIGPHRERRRADPSSASMARHARLPRGALDRRRRVPARGVLLLHPGNSRPESAVAILLTRLSKLRLFLRDLRDHAHQIVQVDAVARSMPRGTDLVPTRACRTSSSVSSGSTQKTSNEI